jgi:hypothetical protein
MAQRARVVGINHVAVEVGDVDEALDFYGPLHQVMDGASSGEVAMGTAQRPHQV